MSRIAAILFDLGNVVLEVDFRRTFQRWADSASVDEAIFYERFTEDAAYQAHEKGELDFEGYVAALTETLGVSMSYEDWHTGWNDVFIGPYPGVQAKLKALSGRLPLFAFTNTNPTHEVEWHARYSHALDRFAEIYVSSTIGLRKPDQQAFEWVTAAMQLAPEEILFLDDNPENIAGAQRAGLTTVQTLGEDEVLAALAEFDHRLGA